jgi:hypothetical protein
MEAADLFEAATSLLLTPQETNSAISGREINVKVEMARYWKSIIWDAGRVV